MKYEDGTEAALGDLVIGKGDTIPRAIIGTVVLIEEDSIVVNAAATVKVVDGLHVVTTLTPNVNEAGKSENFIHVADIEPDQPAQPVNGVEENQAADTESPASSPDAETPAT